MGERAPDTTAVTPGEADETRTVVGTPPTTTGGASSTGMRTLSFASDAMLLDQVGRVSVFARLMILLCALGMASVPFLHGDHVAKGLFGAGLGIAIVSASAMLWLTLDPARYSDARVAIAVQFQCLAGLAAMYYFGAFSPFPCIVSLAIYVYGLSASTKHAVLGYINLATGQSVLAGLMIAGVLDDRGLVHADYLPLREKVITQVNVQMVYLLALVLGRLSRRKTQEAIERMESATRAVAQREALLEEARQEIERAAFLGGPGRFTEQVLGSYKLGVVIGRGAMGEVYEAVHTETGELAAVKLLQRAQLTKPPSLARFTRETRIAASLESPHVVAIKEVGGADSALPYLAMERLDGHDLAHYLRDTPRVRMELTLEMVEQVARGLEAAHAAGIVHRDLKPHNVFRNRNPEGGYTWKILDFGVSKLVDEGDTLTGGGLVGTPGYMAPEQARGDDIDSRADVYSLAVIAYRCITGHPAFAGKDVVSVIRTVVAEMPLQPSLLADVAADVEAVLAVGLAKRPGRRFATASQLAKHLRDAHEGVLEPAVVTRAAAVLATTPWGADTEKRRRRRLTTRRDRA